MSSSGSYTITDPTNIPWPYSALLVDGKKPIKLQRPYTVLGTPITRVGGIQKATGAVKYADDIYDMKNMLYAEILRCPHARANVVSIDTSKAEALPGVVLVLSPKNTYFYSMWYDNGEPMFYKTVAYQGAEVAAVAAEDPETALKAISLIDVKYEVLPHVTTIEQATAPNAPLVDPTLTSNMVPTNPSATTSRGNAQQAVSGADKVVEENYSFGSTTHACIQTRSIVANWDGTTLTTFDSHQNVHQNRLQYSQAFGLPLEQVRVVSPYIGSGWGSKGGAQRFAFVASYMSLLTKRPVRVHLSREEENLVHPHRFELDVNIKSGVMNDGTIKGLIANTMWNGSAPSSSFALGSFNGLAAISYNIPNLEVHDNWVMTNTGMTGPQRSVADIWSIVTLESHVDSLAHAIGMDPLQFRLKNYNYWADPPTNSIPFAAKHQDQAVNYVANQIGWAQRDQFKAQSVDPLYYGVGIAMYTYGGGGIPPFKDYAIIEIDNQANITLRVGVVDIGGNQPGTFAIFAAEELGCKYSDINVIWGDTASTPYGCSQNATRTTAEMGPPVIQAAYDAKTQLFNIAAPMLGVTPDKLESANGMIYVVANPSSQVSFQQVAAKIQGKVTGYGSRVPNYTAAALGLKPQVGNTFGGAAAKVSVNLDTGKVFVLDWAASHDCSQPVNLLTARSQVMSGVNQSIGHGLYERFIWEPNDGTMLTDDWLYYKLPTIADVAAKVDTSTIGFMEGYDPFFAFSAKGIGEAPICGMAAAIRNAVLHATGVLVNEYPLTPDNVLRALKAAGKGKFV